MKAADSSKVKRLIARERFIISRGLECLIYHTNVLISDILSNVITSVIVHVVDIFILTQTHIFVTYLIQI